MSIYRIFHAGAWRSVTALYRGEKKVRHPADAYAAVFRWNEAFGALAISPGGEVFTEWRPELPDESSWETVD